jgi:ectoine hydroxylase-related dioxygenase (phytanoyl-CoA dioxygenase family)
MMSLDQARFEVETYGFTILPGVLRPDEARELRTIGARLERERGEDHRFGGVARHLSNLVMRDPAYLRLIDHPGVLPLIEALLGTRIILGSLNSRIVRPGDGDQEMHGDVPGCLRRGGPPMMVNTVWMLEDWTEESGATRVVPGSHRMPEEFPPRDRHLPHVLRALAPIGSVLVFDGRTWHGGGANCGASDRHGLFGHYRVADWMTFQCDPHREFPNAWRERLSPRGRELLRMEGGVRGQRWVEDSG